MILQIATPFRSPTSAGPARTAASGGSSNRRTAPRRELNSSLWLLPFFGTGKIFP